MEKKKLHEQKGCKRANKKCRNCGEYFTVCPIYGYHLERIGENERRARQKGLKLSYPNNF